MVTTFDPFGAALMINRSNCIYLFKFFLCILSGNNILYYWIISTGYSKHEFGTINMFYASKTTCHITPPPPHHGHFPLSPRFPFDCRCISLSFSVFFFSFSIRTTSSNRLTASGSMEVCIYCIWISACPQSLKYIAHAGAHKKIVFSFSYQYC